jgi:hypothetical protein
MKIKGACAGKESTGEDSKPRNAKGKRKRKKGEKGGRVVSLMGMPAACAQEGRKEGWRAPDTFNTTSRCTHGRSDRRAPKGDRAASGRAFPCFGGTLLCSVPFFAWGPDQITAWPSDSQSIGVLLLGSSCPPRRQTSHVRHLPGGAFGRGPEPQTSPPQRRAPPRRRTAVTGHCEPPACLSQPAGACLIGPGSPHLETHRWAPPSQTPANQPSSTRACLEALRLRSRCPVIVPVAGRIDTRLARQCKVSTYLVYQKCPATASRLICSPSLRVASSRQARVFFVGVLAPAPAGIAGTRKHRQQVRYMQ